MVYNSHALKQNRALQKSTKVVAPLSAAELNTEVVPSVAHEMSQEADLLAIASAGALSSSSAGVQLLTADEQDAVKGGLK